MNRSRAADEVNRLYEAASDLLEAASDLRGVAQGNHAMPAHPSVLGCIETALLDLEKAVAAIRHATDQPSDAADPDRYPLRRMALMHRGVENLEIALRDAATAASAARSLSSRALQPVR